MYECHVLWFPWQNADIEMGRLITSADNPTVLYVSGGNTQVSFVTFHQSKTMNYESPSFKWSLHREMGMFLFSSSESKKKSM